MASNNLQNETDAVLLAKGEQASAVILAAGGAYGTSLIQDGALTAANTAMDTAITDKQAARDASKAATQQALAARTAIIDAMSSIAATIYNNPAVTDQMLADAGFAVHDTTPTKHYPVTPTTLVAVPSANGDVRLTWDGGGNVRGTTYQIEGSADGSTWSILTSTTAQKITLSGYTPGQAYWFRVAAVHNGQTSVPSDSEPVWGTGGASSLTIAA